jgi:hypothetical protein
MYKDIGPLAVLQAMAAGADNISDPMRGVTRLLDMGKLPVRDAELLVGLVRHHGVGASTVNPKKRAREVDTDAVTAADAAAIAQLLDKDDAAPAPSAPKRRRLRRHVLRKGSSGAGPFCSDGAWPFFVPQTTMATRMLEVRMVRIARWTSPRTTMKKKKMTACTGLVGSLCSL